MNWIFNFGISGFCIVFYTVILNGAIGGITFQFWKLFKIIWRKRGTYRLLYNFLKIVIALFLVPFGWFYITLKNYNFNTGISYDWYPWINFKIAVFLFLLFVVWLLGAIYHLQEYMKEKMRLRNIRMLGIVLDDEKLDKIYLELPETVHYKKKIPIVICRGLHVPMVTGIFKKYIYLPDYQYDPETLKIILSHELTHVYHKDLLFKNLSAVITIAYWFWPFFRKLFQEYDGWSEVICDMELCMESRAKWTAKQYYSVLLREIEKSGTQNFKMCSALYETKNTMKWRVESVKNYHEMKEKSKLLACIFAVVFGVSCPATVFAAGNIAEYGLNEIYEGSMVEIRESSEQPEYVDSLVEQYESVLDDTDIMTIEVTPQGSATSGSYTWEIEKGSRVSLSSVSLKKGQTVAMGISFSSGSGPVAMGIIKGTTKRSVSLDSNGMHNFEIKEDGIYKLYVENKSNGKIKVDFNYFVF